MAYSLEQKEELLNVIFESIENGKSLRKSLLENNLPAITFYQWIEQKDEKGELTDWAKEKSKQYTRACEARADFVFEEILEISDNRDSDFKPFVGVNAIQRDKVMIDARKWWLSKIMPKKYGDRIDMTTNGKDLPSAPSSITVQIVTEDDEE